MEGINSSLAQTQETISKQMQDFSSAAEAGIPGVKGSNEFLAANTTVAKMAFLILVLIVFVFILHLAIYVIGYLTRPPSSPYIVQGMITGSDALSIAQDPQNSESIPLQRSNDQTTGMEFTWALWLKIDKNKTQIDNKAAHIFNKGNAVFDSKGIATVNNAPGLYLLDGDAGNNATNNATNTLRFMMDTVDPTTKNDVLDIPNVPFGKWVHVVVRLENLHLDAYVNGTIVKRLTLAAVPKQNYDNINVCNNGGFTGALSNLRYYNYALSVFEINAVVLGGPNLTASPLSAGVKATGTAPYFLSSSWYSSNY